jgi:hypothetical protein
MNRLHHWPLVFWILSFLVLGGGLLAIQSTGAKTPMIAGYSHKSTTILSVSDRSSIDALSTSFSSLEEALGSGGSLTPWARNVVSVAQPALISAHKEGNSVLVKDYSLVLSEARSIVANPQSSVSGRWRQATTLSGYVVTLITASVA